MDKNKVLTKDCLKEVAKSREFMCTVADTICLAVGISNVRKVGFKYNYLYSAYTLACGALTAHSIVSLNNRFDLANRVKASALKFKEDHFKK